MAGVKETEIQLQTFEEGVGGEVGEGISPVVSPNLPSSTDWTLTAQTIKECETKVQGDEVS